MPMPRRQLFLLVQCLSGCANACALSVAASGAPTVSTSPAPPPLRCH